MYKFYICAAVFLGLSAVKFLAPAQTENLRNQIISIIDSDDNYPQMVEALGRKLSQEGLGEELIKVFDFSDDASTPALEELYPETVSVFLESQQKFAGFEIPDNVDPNMPQLPFEYAKPVSGSKSSGFGYREHPSDLQIKFHYGTDYAAAMGDNVYAFAEGAVYAAGTNDTFGNYLIISHSDGYCSLYGHLSSFEVTEGSRVSKGQLIAKVGDSGNADGAHLHFELSRDGMYLNPEYYV